jgi:hypothetical protein
MSNFTKTFLPSTYTNILLYIAFVNTFSFFFHFLLWLFDPFPRHGFPGFFLQSRLRLAALRQFLPSVTPTSCRSAPVSSFSHAYVLPLCASFSYSAICRHPSALIYSSAFLRAFLLRYFQNSFSDSVVVHPSHIPSSL